MRPLISVVIPTFKRPNLVCRAVASVLAQTFLDLEVIVVIDGADTETVDRLSEVNDARLRVIQLVANGGPAKCRNTGIQAARGEWLALLDDDDEWYPEKLKKQIAIPLQDPWFRGIVACRVRVRTPSKDCIWPDYPIANGQDVADYLLDRPSVLGRPGFIHTSSLLAPRDVFVSIPFELTPDHEDWTFIIKACKEKKLSIRFVWEALCVYHFDPDALSQSRRAPWQASYRWARDMYPLLTPRAYSSFMLSKVVGKARMQSDYEGLWTALVSAIVDGAPRLRHLAIFCGMCLLPRPVLRKAVDASFGRRAKY